MSIYEIGRICVKIAGRDAGRKCVVVENVDDKFVMIDGNVRRKKVNIKHLEPLAETVEIKDKASHEDVKAAFDKLGLQSLNNIYFLFVDCATPQLDISETTDRSAGENFMKNPH